MTITADDITSALKKIGPCSPGKLAEELGVEQLPGLVLKQLIEDETIKAAGAARGRRLALPDQKIEDAKGAPPQKRKKPRKGKKAKKPRKPQTRRAPPAARSAERFMPMVDVERRLVVINGGAEPLIYTAEQTLAIATLLFNHYEA